MSAPPKLCAGCLARPRRYACLRCGDALCRRCVAARACCSLSDEIRERGRQNIVAPAPERVGAALAALEQVAPVQPAAEQLITDLMTSSAAPPPASRAGETPAPSTTPRDCPPDAGSGRASTARGAYGPRPGSLVDHALKLAALGPFTARQLASATKQPLASVRTQLGKMHRAGTIVYSGRPKTPRDGDCGTYSLPAQPRSDLEASQLRPVVPPPSLRRLPSASAVNTPASAVALHPRARGPVPGQHVRPADFYADKPALPAARAPQVSERGERHG